MTRWGKVIRFEKKRGLLGWKSSLVKKRSTFSVVISKIVADGCGLWRGQHLACYYFVNENGRPVVEVFLDGRDKEGKMLEQK
jgi:hypothetical protein